MPSDLRRITFGVHGNSDDYVLDGWSGNETKHRWMVGHTSSIKLPPLAISEDVIFRFLATPFMLDDNSIIQTMDIFVNGEQIGNIILFRGLRYYQVIIKGGIISPHAENQILFIHPNAASPSLYGGTDSRILSVAMHEMHLESCQIRVFLQPILLSQMTLSETQDAEFLKNLAMRFQSLGQNCEFGLFQRRCGAEPLGLLRFSSIFLPKLVHGLLTQFSGIGDLDSLSFEPDQRGHEYIGRHSFYGLAYHTFKNVGEIDLEQFKKSEAKRLRYLGNLLIEQISDAEKIFVIQCPEINFIISGINVLLQIIHSINPHTVILLVTQVGMNEQHLVGRVEQVGPSFFRGYISRLAPGDNAHDLDFEGWVKICATVAQSVDEGVERARL